MENIYDIRLKEKLLFILPTMIRVSSTCSLVPKSVAIAVNLYYEETVEQYMAYLNAIPEEIDVYILSSRPGVFEKVNCIKKRSMVLLEKDNRGRDVSALLVTFREIAHQYEYICFLHDKKEKKEYLKDDVKVWVKNLWENTIASKEYINNVLDLFCKHQDIGLLVPPEPLGEYLDTWYGEVWGANYENVLTLAKELKLSCNICRDKMPITVGTVFWARTASLAKLLEKEWTYEDFPQEPLYRDGTISHAIERILSYVAQDAGFKTGTIMTSAYAEWNFLYAQDLMRRTLENNKSTVLSIQDFNLLKQQEKEIKNFFEENDKVYFYGAGKNGIELLERVKAWGLTPTGFLVSPGNRLQKEIQGCAVYELQELEQENNVGVVITVADYSVQADIVEVLRIKGYDNYIMSCM